MKTVWIARFVAVVMLFVFAMCFANLHRRLTQMQQDRPAAKRSR